MDKRELKMIVKKLSEVKGHHTTLVSYYIPPDRDVAQVTKRLDEEYSTSSNIKSKQTRNDVLMSINAIRQELRKLKQGKVGEHGIACFAGNGEVYMIYPPEDVPSMLYRCDSSFVLEPLEFMVEDKAMVGIVVVDQNEATLARIKGSKLEILKYKESHIQGKHGRGGQSKQRFERDRELKVKMWYRAISELCTEFFMDDKIVKVVVGGPSFSKQDFIDIGELDHRIKAKLAAVVDVGYATESGVRELLPKVTDVLEENAQAIERKQLTRFFEALRENKATYGEVAVRGDLKKNRLEMILIAEGNETEFPEAEDFGTEIMYIDDDFDDGAMFCRTFVIGGIRRW